MSVAESGSPAAPGPPAEAAAALAVGRSSPVDLTERLPAGIEAAEPHLHALVSTTAAAASCSSL